MRNMSNEVMWNNDLIMILINELKIDFPNIKIIKGKILKDIFLHKDQKSLKYKIQFGFVDQDIVFYEEEMNISNLYNVNNIKIHRNNKDRIANMIIPKLICELKYNGVNSHGLITYSEYASDIKSIFPECKYWLALRYRGNSTENKLYRHGKNFDKIIFFDNSKAVGNYQKGDFKRQIERQTDLKRTFEEFLEELKVSLRKNETVFIK